MNQRDYNLYRCFSEQFSTTVEKVFLTTENGEQYTFKDIDQLSAQYANYLIQLGAKAGDRISTQIEKSAQALCLYFACLRAGLVYHPLNTAYNKIELEYFFSNADPFAIICDVQNLSLIKDSLGSTHKANILTMNKDGQGSFIDKTAACSIEFLTITRSENDLAALLYSSGTTGVPKDIMLTHGNLLANAKSLVKAWGFSKDDVLLHCLPVFHVHGLFIAMGCILLTGASMRWLSAFNTKNVIKYLPESTVMMGVPTYYTRLLADKQFNKQVSRNVRLFISGSAPLKETTFALFKERTGQSILERYGMTETGVNTANPLDGERKPGTVGLPLTGVELHIVDDTGDVLHNGEIGNIQVRGANVFSGYWQLPDKSEQAFTADGFFDTGDKGQVDSEGYISIVGRSKDLIISGGLNIYPKEIEVVMDNLSGIEESGVIGVPHADFGEAVVAFVIESNKNTLMESKLISELKHCIANFKVPKRIIFLDELPKNTMGKVQKNILRERYKNIAL